MIRAVYAVSYRDYREIFTLSDTGQLDLDTASTDAAGRARALLGASCAAREVAVDFDAWGASLYEAVDAPGAISIAAYSTDGLPADTRSIHDFLSHYVQLRLALLRGDYPAARAMQVRKCGYLRRHLAAALSPLVREVLRLPQVSRSCGRVSSVCGWGRPKEHRPGCKGYFS